MKKYLLLAATAMLFSTNARAELENQTANVNINASVVPICEFEVSSGNIEFGTIYVNDEFTVELSSDGEINSTSESVIDIDDNHNSAYISTTCSYPTFTVSCVNGGSTSTGCNIGDTDYKIIPSSGSNNMGTWVSGTLTGPKPDSTVNLTNSTALLLTLSYE